MDRTYGNFEKPTVQTTLAPGNLEKPTARASLAPASLALHEHCCVSRHNICAARYGFSKSLIARASLELVCFVLRKHG